MIQISISNLTQETIYPRVLQTIEDICDQYQLNREFGFISTACQEIVEHLLGYHPGFSVDMDVFVEGTEMSFVFTSHTAVFADIMDHYDEENILKDLSDRVDISSDHKSVNLTFHVKTHHKVLRNMPQEEQVYQKFNIDDELENN